MTERVDKFAVRRAELAQEDIGKILRDRFDF